MKLFSAHILFSIDLKKEQQKEALKNIINFKFEGVFLTSQSKIILKEYKKLINVLNDLTKNSNSEYIKCLIYFMNYIFFIISFFF